MGGEPPSRPRGRGTVARAVPGRGWSRRPRPHNSASRAIASGVGRCRPEPAPVGPRGALPSRQGRLTLPMRNTFGSSARSASTASGPSWQARASHPSNSVSASAGSALSSTSTRSDRSGSRSDRGRCCRRVVTESRMHLVSNRLRNRPHPTEQESPAGSRSTHLECRDYGATSSNPHGPRCGWESAPRLPRGSAPGTEVAGDTLFHRPPL